MKKNIIILLFATFQCCAMENVGQPTEKATEKIKIIEGVVVLHPHESVMYSIYLQENIKETYNLEVIPSEPMISIRALRGDGSDKIPLFLPETYGGEFTQSLPLHLLLGKKDGDLLTFMVGDERKIILKCDQKLYHPSDKFENRLKILLEDFKKGPDWHEFDKKKLIKLGVIEKVSMLSSLLLKKRYKHGPNGYKFN